MAALFLHKYKLQTPNMRITNVVFLQLFKVPKNVEINDAQKFVKCHRICHCSNLNPLLIFYIFFAFKRSYTLKMNAISKFIQDFYTNKIWKNTAPILLFCICQQREFYIFLRFVPAKIYCALNGNNLFAINKRQTPYVTLTIMDDLWEIFLLFEAEVFNLYFATITQIFRVIDSRWRH